MAKKTAHLHENTSETAIRRCRRTCHPFEMLPNWKDWAGWILSHSRCPAALVFSRPMLTYYIFLSFWLLCFSPLTSLFIYLLCFFLASPVLGLFCSEESSMKCCVTVWSCFQALHDAISVSADRTINLQSHVYLYVYRCIQKEGVWLFFLHSCKINLTDFPREISVFKSTSPVFNVWTWKPWTAQQAH